MKEPTLFHDQYRVASTRLPGYDYGQSGAYFVTVCTQGRQPHFGTVEVPDGEWAAAFVRPTALGQRVLSGWESIPRFAPFATPDKMAGQVGGRIALRETHAVDPFHGAVFHQVNARHTTARHELQGRRRMSKPVTSKPAGRCMSCSRSNCSSSPGS